MLIQLKPCVIMNTRRESTATLIFSSHPRHDETLTFFLAVPAASLKLWNKMGRLGMICSFSNCETLYDLQKKGVQEL